jgi:hypothetical protein
VSTPPTVTIKLEIQIPTNGAAPTVEVVGDELRPLPPWRLLAPGSTCPDGTANVHVNPSGSVGSDPPSGSICAWVRYANQPDAGNASVQAQVVQNLSSLGSTPSGAINGQPTDGTRLVWTWQANQSNVLPGAVYSPAGKSNYVVFWTKANSQWSKVPVNFTGIPGSPGACDCPPPVKTVPPVRPPSRTHPAVWVVDVGGFAARPLEPFNATWALRRVTAEHPTWDNAADGQAAPHVRLKLCPTNGWELELRFQSATVGYALPYAADPFGPLDFPERREDLPGLGSVVLPRIVVSTL